MCPWSLGLGLAYPWKFELRESIDTEVEIEEDALDSCDWNGTGTKKDISPGLAIMERRHVDKPSNISSATRASAVVN